MRIIDRRNQALGHNQIQAGDKRNITAIRNLGIHHSATTSGNSAAFENHFRSMGWRLGGYGEVILPNGDIELNYNPEVITNGVGGHNPNNYHICLVGSFTTNGIQPPVAQMRSLLERIRVNVARFVNVSFDRVFGHNEFANTGAFNHSSNICPGLDMANLRNQLNTPTPPVTNNTSTHTVRKGETLSGIAQQHRTTTTELARLNSITNVNLINTGQVLRLPTTNTAPTWRVGSNVRVNLNAQRWLTGENIPSNVRGQTYDVQQIGRNGNNNHVLIGRNGVHTGWLNRSDVTLL